MISNQLKLLVLENKISPFIDQKYQYFKIGCYYFLCINAFGNNSWNLEVMRKRKYFKNVNSLTIKNGLRLQKNVCVTFKHFIKWRLLCHACKFWNFHLMFVICIDTFYIWIICLLHLTWMVLLNKEFHCRHLDHPPLAALPRSSTKDLNQFQILNSKVNIAYEIKIFQL